jgi:hypothetical protein
LHDEEKNCEKKACVSSVCEDIDTSNKFLSDESMIFGVGGRFFSLHPPETKNNPAHKTEQRVQGLVSAKSNFAKIALKALCSLAYKDFVGTLPKTRSKSCVTASLPSARIDACRHWLQA